MIRGNAGSGRTTLIRILDQKIKPNEGTLLCRGSIAAIYETTGILESMTLGEQIALPLCVMDTADGKPWIMLQSG